MITEHNPYDDLYEYDGYEKVTSDLVSAPQVRQPRQDSAVDFETMADAIHNEAVGTLFAPQAAAEIPSQVTPPTATRETVDMENHTQTGPESSVFARYDARAEQRRGNVSQTISALRQWLEGFTLPQAALANSQQDLTIENDASHHILRKRSLSAQAAEVVALTFPSRCSADDSCDSTDADESVTCQSEEDDTDTTSSGERLSLLLSAALPLLPFERTSEWDERQRVREKYNSIERARAIRVENERRSAQDRERNLETSVNNWTEEEQNRKLIESSWPDGNLEASIIEELKYGDYLYNEMFSMIKFEDLKLYIIPRLWDFTDIPRRTRLYSNTAYILQYLRRERSVVLLIQSRLEDLQEGRSKQSEATVAEEIEILENALELRGNAEEDYLNILCDFLDWAIAHTTLEIRDSANGGPKPTRPNALTNDIPLAIVEDVTETEPELNDRFERLRDLERSYFPERFLIKALPPNPPPIQMQPQYTPRGRQIPVRQQMLPQDGSTDDDDSSSELQFGERLTRTLPRSFKPNNNPLLRVKEFDPHPVPTLDKKMQGEPTSPVKPPETNYLRPPKPKRKLPLRMWKLPHKVEEYSPELLVPFKLSKSASARISRYKFRTGLDVDVLRNYDQLLREFSSRASVHWVVPTTSGYGQWNDEDDEDAEGSGRVLRIVNSDPSDDFEEMLDADDFKRVEDQSFFDALENQDSTVHAQEDSVVRVEDSAVRVIDFALPRDTNSTQSIDSAHLIEQIEGLDDIRAKKSLPLARKESVWWSSNASQEYKKGLEITVTEIEDSDHEEDADEEVPAEQVGLFQRPISRAEHRREGESEVNATETESSDLDSDTFHESPEQTETMISVDGDASQAQDSSEVDAGIANAETERTGTESEDEQTPAQHVNPVERPSSRAQQIIERQPELTPDEIDGYDTEEEELQRQSLSRTRRSNHASRY